jgi:hypothetical protein
MRRSRWLGTSLAAFLGSVGLAHAQYNVISPAPGATFGTPQAIVQAAPQAAVQAAPQAVVQAPANGAQAPAGGGDSPIVGNQPEGRGVEEAASAGQAAPSDAPLGPTPLPAVNIINDLLWGSDAKDAPFKVSAWLETDYTYRSSGTGQNNIAPVMNRFGDEWLMREMGIYLYRPLDPKTLSWGFNCIFMAGSDASFLTPTAGGWRNTDPRFGTEFNDLNLTLHLPILSEGGIDIKAGRQTTILGPMGALAWQRYFASSDYAWYNLEEGRYTGVSSIWHISKRLDWYNGIEFGWGSFFDYYSPAPQYITNISYWLDEEAKNTKVWTTVLTGPTGMEGNTKVWTTVLTGPTGMEGTGDTTVFELGLQTNWNKYWYQIIDTQMCWSHCPIFGPKPPGYRENAYDVYTYLGVHLNSHWDLNSRLEWYYDQDGGGYPGGFGVPNTSYYNVTVGPDYHPVKWLQFRPEVRWDIANHDNFGPKNDKKDQVSIVANMVLKF